MALYSLKALLPIRHKYRDENQVVVFTNGCFDILHAGHVIYLEEAKAQGDILVVALNSDQSVKKIKGEQRPIIGQDNRAKLVAGLKAVDHVLFFDEDTPIQVIQELQPDIHVKGGDYEASSLPEYDSVTDYGGQVKVLSFVEGLSTSTIINKIKSTC